jgi:hypothetical protein
VSGVSLVAVSLLGLSSAAQAAGEAIAVDDSYRTPVGQTLSVSAPGYLENDTRNGACIALGSFPSHGTLSNFTEGGFVYAPDAGFSGVDSFTYSFEDCATAGEPLSTATITIRVEAVDAVDDSYSVNAGETLTVEGGEGVTENDTRPGSYLTLLVDDTDHGDLTFFPQYGTFTYTPDAGYAGTDTFRYSLYNANHPTSNDTATVTITVVDPNPDPVAVDDLYSTPIGVQLTVNAADGVLDNDTGGATSVALATDVPRGTLALSTNGSFVYTPQAGDYGQVTFTYTATGPGGTSAPATVTIRVVPPIVAADDSYTVDQGEVLTVLSGPVITSGILSNDTIAGDRCGCSVEVESQPTHGTLSPGPGAGGFTYTPDPTFHGTDSFTYRAVSSVPYRVESNIATVNITVNPDDTTVPSVTIVKKASQADPTGTSPIDFSVEFSETVTGFADADVEVTGTAGATTVNVTGSGTTYNVAVSGMTASGTVTAKVKAGAATDGTNASTASGTATVQYDKPPSMQCGGKNATIVGTAGSDVLTGTGGADVIVGLGGNDQIKGGSANDIICGGDGTDTIDGGSGNDTLNGDGGNDTLQGGSNDDRLDGGSGADSLTGGSDKDNLTGGTGSPDRCDGGSGTDSGGTGCETKVSLP